MIENNRIIIIDDSEEDLATLRKVFYDHGIGCKGFVYDDFNFPKQPLKGVRFAFFDIHLNQSGDTNSTLKDAIRHYIDSDNGPYILIFWSNNTELIDSFIAFVNRQEDDFKSNLKPLFITAIDKTDFLSPDKKLEERVDSILSSDFVKCIIKFDESVLIAARETINKILGIIPYPKNWNYGVSTESDLLTQQVFSNIAFSLSGLSYAKSNPDLAIKESIAPIFKHALEQSNDNYWRIYLKPLQIAETPKDLTLPKNVSTEKLNSIFHIDTTPENLSIRHRGAVCPFILNDKEDVFNNFFEITYNDWISKTFKYLHDNCDSNEIQLIALEFSAACDFSQNKIRTNKYILGVLFPSNFSPKLKKGLAEFAYLLPFNFEYNDKEVAIGLNLNFTFNLPAANNILIKPLFILSKETMDMIGHKYSSHLSRIGITSFE